MFERVLLLGKQTEILPEPIYGN